MSRSELVGELRVLRVQLEHAKEENELLYKKLDSVRRRQVDGQKSTQSLQHNIERWPLDNNKWQQETPNSPNSWKISPSSKS